DTTNQATATILSGGTVTVDEQLPPAGQANVGAYTSAIACTPPAGFTPGGGGQAGTLVVPATPVDVTCTITNTRAATGHLTLQHPWVNGASGDSADLAATGGQQDGASTAVVPGGGTGTSPDKVVVPIAAGDSVDLSEILGAGDTGRYTSALA